MNKKYIYGLIICIFFGFYVLFIENTKIDKTNKTFDLVHKIEKKTISLNFVGDILAARAIELTMRKTSYDYPFLKIVNDLSDADITFANLETPLIGTATSGKTTVGGTTVFRGDVDFAKALKRAGIDIVSIANNHMKDQGKQGLLSTIQSLIDSDVYYVGAGEDLDKARALTIVETKGIHVGYLAYNDSDVVPESYHATNDQSGTNIMNIDRLKEDVKNARSKVDVLIVSMHSGTEYVTSHPNIRQIEFAHAAIDEGADFVIGHHPHVLQPLEIYKGKYIFYSLGNFVFDQPWPDTKESALINMRINFTKEDKKSALNSWNIDSYSPTIVPLIIQNFQPQRTDDNVKNKKIIERFLKEEYVFSLGNQNMFIEIATTSEKRIIGLSNRKQMNKESGLMLVFDKNDKHGIWMKDMFFPIDIYWFDKDFKLIDKALSVPIKTYPNVFYPNSDALYVLETPEGMLSNMSLTNNLTGELTYIHSYDKR